MHKISPDRKEEEDKEGESESFKPLSAEEAREWRKSHPVISPWATIGWQGAAGLLASMIAWAVTGRTVVAVSVGYGVLSILIPALVFARGMASRLTSINPQSAAAGFMLWEAVKLALTVAMLVAAPRLLAEVSWPALVVGLVVSTKVYWIVFGLRPGRRVTT